MHDSDLWTDDQHFDAGEALTDAAGLYGRRTWPEGLYGFAWMVVLMAPTFLLASAQWHHLHDWAATLPQPHWWTMHHDGWLWVPLGLLAFAGLWISFSSLGLTSKAASLLLVLSASVAWDCVMMRSYHVIIGREVVVQPVLPWKPVSKFRLDDATVVGRGCDHDSDDKDRVIFRVGYGTSGSETVDLGEGVGRKGAADWLKVMEPYAPSGIALPPESVRDVPHDQQCLDEVAAELDPEQRAALIRLLS